MARDGLLPKFFGKVHPKFRTPSTGTVVTSSLNPSQVGQSVTLTATVTPATAWPLLVIFCVVMGFVWYGNHSIIEFNLKSPRPPLALALKSSPVFNR